MLAPPTLTDRDPLPDVDHMDTEANGTLSKKREGKEYWERTNRIRQVTLSN